MKTPSAQQWESPIASYEVSGSQELIRTHRRSIVWTSAKTARTLCQAATTTASSYMIFGKESTWNLFVKSYYNRWYRVIMLCLLCALSGWPLFCLGACRPIGTLFSKKYGVDHIRYAHGDTETVVYSSNKLDGNNVVRTWRKTNKQHTRAPEFKPKCSCLADTIRYLSLSDNKYIRYFPGHTAR